MKTGDIAALLVQGMQQQDTGNTDIGYHTGVVTAWDDLTALNTVTIDGNEFNNLRVITPGPAINIETGDVVVIVRIKTQYFIWGKVAAPGASAAIRSVSDFRTAPADITDTEYVDFPGDPGPTVSTYVGPSGKVLVSISCQVLSNNGAIAGGEMSFAIRGANNEDAAGFRAAMASVDVSFQVTATNTVQVIDLVPGVTTFTAQYRSQFGNAVNFSNRSLVVIPM